MTKAVLISIRPRWIEKIARGEKTIEVRKTRPNLSTPFKCYIYHTLPKSGDWNERAGRVVGEFTCDVILPITVFDNGSIQNWNAYSLKEDCMSYEDMADYIGYGKQGYGWHISDLKIYDEPKELSEFTKPCPEGHNCAACSWYFPGIQDYGRCEPPCCGYWESDDSLIARPPQSWMYVEGD